jgi:hypothetical protein
MNSGDNEYIDKHICIFEYILILSIDAFQHKFRIDFESLHLNIYVKV